MSAAKHKLWWAHSGYVIRSANIRREGLPFRKRRGPPFPAQYYIIMIMCLFFLADSTASSSSSSCSVSSGGDNRNGGGGGSGQVNYIHIFPLCYFVKIILFFFSVRLWLIRRRPPQRPPLLPLPLLLLSGEEPVPARFLRLRLEEEEQGPPALGPGVLGDEGGDPLLAGGLGEEDSESGGYPAWGGGGGGGVGLGQAEDRRRRRGGEE